MQQYFVTRILHTDERIAMDKEQAHHIANVMRMKEKERIRLADPKGHLFFAEVEFAGKEVFAKVGEKIMDTTRGSVRITLAQGLIKKEKWDLLLQKSAELGVAAIQPFISSRCVVKAKEEKQEKKLLRWKKILQEACEQCKRSTLVELYEPCAFQALKELKADLRLIAYEGADQLSCRLSDILKKHPTVQSVVVVIGCEGGFSLEEVRELEACGYQRISLGSRILRAETAAMAVIDRISFYYDEMAGDAHEELTTTAE